MADIIIYAAICGLICFIFNDNPDPKVKLACLLGGWILLPMTIFVLIGGLIMATAMLWTNKRN